MSDALQQQTDRLIRWFTDEALELWRERGLDAVTGANVERLLPSGEPDLTANVRVRVQARQAFFYAAAQHLGWCDDGSQIAGRLLDFVATRASHPSAGGGYTHLLNSDWQVIDARQDIYDHAFFLLAFAWQFRVTNNPEYLVRADKLIAHLDQCFAAPAGGWYEGDYPYTYRRQNPHMHLFEAFMALYEASENQAWLARAKAMFTLFEQHFYAADEQVLLEFFTEDWAPAPDAKGRVVEPGHMMEWVWLLDWYGRLTGQDVDHYTRALYGKALDIGVNDAGLLYDSVTPEGDILQHTKRCWGLTEFIKASLVLAGKGEPGAREAAASGVERLFTYYLDVPVSGSYVDQRGAADEVIDPHAPASSLYHLIVVAMELLRFFGRLPG